MKRNKYINRNVILVAVAVVAVAIVLIARGPESHYLSEYEKNALPAVKP